MNKKFKFLTVLLALVMTLGAFAPFSARAEEGTPNTTTTDETTKTVTLHKILMDKDAFSKFTAGTTGKDGTEYDGTSIGDKNIDENKNEDEKKEQYKQNIANYFGGTSKEIAGVYFVLKFADDYKDQDKQGKYVKRGADALTPAEPLEPTDDIEKAVGGLTTDSGLVFNTSKLEGNFEIDEIHDKSTYKGTVEIKDANGHKTTVNTQLTDNKAVPVKITLPLVNEKGVVEDAHVYPKNTEDKPRIDKNFAEDSDLTKAEDGKPVNKGANYDNYEMEKDTANARVGLEVKYQVKTEIPAKSHLKEAHWDDRMTEGLTFKQDSLKIKVDGKELNPKEYELDVREDGFDLRLTDKGLERVNGKDAAVTVELKYSAIVNEKAKVDIPDSNDVTFHYGHKKGEGNTPVPTNPKDGKIKVEKSWAEEVDLKNIVIKVQLYDANTGKAEQDEKTLTMNTETGKLEAVWEGLKNDHQYKALETVYDKEGKVVATFEAEYGVGEVGTITIKNHKSDNPKPLNPTEPKVVTGGKKFVKTNQDKTERLAGAEFYVRDGETKDAKYLVLSSNNAEAVKNAKAARDKAYKEYNSMTKEQQDGPEGTAKKAEMENLQKEYHKLFMENNSKYEFKSKAEITNFDENKSVIILTSNEEGQFEITGLAYGTYYLDEKTAPEGYAKLSGPVKFVVEKGSYENGVQDPIDYVKESGKNDAQCIANKKVSIPQTGGIGTVIFTVVGVMLMVGAAFALKRRKEDELEGLA
ncbi:hypothetical protein HMPREF1634_04310 [Tissierellia bacterium S7-1-4]|nr:hypothetical protein HMPREF1634_04310 [Tissierellia bacterium S7-1-4]